MHFRDVGWDRSWTEVMELYVPAGDLPEPCLGRLLGVLGRHLARVLNNYVLSRPK